MERLDACYFCGTAGDGPLREVSISPRERRGDPDATVQVTLCPSCEDKLERVLGGLFDHVESRRTEHEDRPDRPARDDGTAETGDEPTPPGRGLVDRIDVSSNEADAAGARGRRRPFTDPDGVADPAAASDDGSPAAEDAEILDDEPRVHARATATPEEALDGVSVAEYNRVMRLLQNREFPMPRDAFVDLAGSAYDLGDETVEAVLDAVIDKGALAERDGQLVREGEESP